MMIGFDRVMNAPIAFLSSLSSATTTVLRSICGGSMCMAKACMCAVRRSLLLLGYSPRLLSAQLRGSTGSRAPLAALEPQIDTVMTEEAAIRCVANAAPDCFRLLIAACTAHGCGTRVASMSGLASATTLLWAARHKRTCSERQR